MKQIVQFIFVSFLAVVLVSCSETKTPTQDFTPKYQADVIGGKKVARDSLIARSTVGIYDVRLNFICTGTLIADQIVLTAAHCVESPAHQIRVVFAFDLLATVNAREVDVLQESVRKVKQTRVHPQYNSDDNETKNDRWNDIAILKFHGTTPEAYKPATLLTDADLLKKGALAKVAGFGSTQVDILEVKLEDFPDLEKAEEAGDIVCDDNRQHCYEIDFDDNDTLHETEAPIEGIVDGEVRLDESEGHGTCVGDSGGPAFIEKDGALYLFGVTSRGSYACDGTGVYTNALDYKEWIDKVVGEMSH